MRALNPIATQVCSRPEDSLAARWLDGAIVRSVHPIKTLAKAIGRSERTLLEMRRGTYRVGLADVVRLPADVREAVLDELARACGFALYRPSSSQEGFVNSAHKLLVASAKATPRLLACADKGAVSPDDATALEPELRAMQRLTQTLLDKCSAAQRDRGVLLEDE
jgi:hypothetical protein